MPAVQPSSASHSSTFSQFPQQLLSYKERIDADITAYAAHARQSARAHYGKPGGLIMDAFLDMMERGGKRLRGALVLTGYQMCGGTDLTMITRAATALEMVHASLLILDDVQDRSDMRRGKPTVHRLLEAYHRDQKLAGDAAHTGVSLALNAHLAGYNAAQMLIGGLHAEAELRAKAMGIISHALLVTAHGQTSDILHECVGPDQVTSDDIDKTMEWKTAYYTILNPLCVGMVLAGAGCEDTDAVRDYALHTGKAFQITDDLMGVFGTDQQMGKSVMDDIREGKQTLLTAYAFAHLPVGESGVLRRSLGNAKLTADEFAACRRLIKDSGAKQYAEDRAAAHVEAAIRSLTPGRPGWLPIHAQFLRDLAVSLQKRGS